tara:strand:+ start:1143 stop:2315 length:1173 start_codon:yes stop_codon:yes gene_type:complete
MANYALMNPGQYRLPNSFNSPTFQGKKYEEDFVPFKTIRWKTACINERKVYAGNVEIVTNDNVTKLLPDTIFKSDLGKFDRFTEKGRIDVATGDGEDIISLKTFADRILEFKDKTLHIINVSGGKEFLEESLKYKGLLNSQAACHTDLGVAWVNKNGVFLYDGRNIQNLLEEGAKRKILPSTWSSFVTNSTQVAYFPAKRQLFIIKSASSSNGNMYIFDFPTKSWIQNDAKFLLGSSSAHQTNIVNYPYSNQEEVVFGQQDSNDIKVTYWQDSASVGVIDIQTKDLDFGNPAIQKLISKIYITSKYAQGITLKASTNGAKDFGGTFNSNNQVTLNTTSLNSAANWVISEHQITGINPDTYSIQLQLSGTAANAGFAINDISIIYRQKGAR